MSDTNPDSIVVPNAQSAEKALASVFMRYDRARAQMRAEGLCEEHFYEPVTRILFRAVTALEAAGKEPELVTLKESLRESGDLEKVGGLPGICEVYSYAVNSHHWRQHFELLSEQWAKRIVQRNAFRLLEDLHELSAGELVGKLRDSLDETSLALSTDRGVCTAQEAVDAYLAEVDAQLESGGMPGLPTGMNAIDIPTGGLRPGELWVISGETSGGKSVVLLQAVAAAIRDGKRALVISLEMDRGMIASRLACCLGRVSYDAFTRPMFANPAQLLGAREAVKSLADMPLSIHDRGGLTLEQIQGIAIAEADRHGALDLLVVDYLQIIEGAKRDRNETREQEVASFSRGLKTLAKRLNCAVFTASQLNDQGRMRESRAIAHDADVVLGIQDDGIRAVKVRNGVRYQLFPLTLNGEYQQFEHIGAAAERFPASRG